MKLALVVPITGETRTELWTDDKVSEGLTAAVDGCFDVVAITPTIDMWVNDEGIIRGMPFNRRATLAAGAHGLTHQGYYGPAVFTGGLDDEGNTLGLAPDDLATLQSLCTRM